MSMLPVSIQAGPRCWRAGLLLVTIALLVQAHASATGLLEARIACGWGYRYELRDQRNTTEQRAWLVELLQYVNNGEVNRDNRSFEERSDVTTSWPSMALRLRDKRYVEWAGRSVTDLLPVLEKHRRTLRSQPESFFAHTVLYEQPVFRRYWSTREKLLEAIQQQLGVEQKDNGVDCN